MPELPEVETVARQLDAVLRGRKVESVEHLLSQYEAVGLPRLLDHTVTEVRRCGKRVVIELTAKGRPLWFAVHLRMTGRLIWLAETDPESASTPSYSKVRIGLSGGVLWFSDLRRFGVLEILDAAPEASASAIDPLSSAFSDRALAGLLSNARGEIKPWLLRQDRIAGIGNIYASEILHAAGIHPQRSAGSLSAVEIKALRHETVRILKLAVKNCGTTFSDFQDSRGKIGGYGRYLKVYNREGQDCLRCGAAITRLVQQQRSTYFCVGCQI